MSDKFLSILLFILCIIVTGLDITASVLYFLSGTNVGIFCGFLWSVTACLWAGIAGINLRNILND